MEICKYHTFTPYKKAHDQILETFVQTSYRWGFSGTPCLLLLYLAHFFMYSQTTKTPTANSNTGGGF